MNARAWLGAGLAAAMLAGAGFLHRDMAELAQSYPTEFRSYYVPPSAYLRVASLGQRNLAADLVFIWAVQYFDMYGSDVRDDYLFHTFDVITDLDPEFYEAYVFGSLFLSLDKRWDLLYRLEDKGISANPKNWLIPWDAATYAFFQAKDYDKAQHYLSVADGRNGNVPVIKRLLANVFKYKKDYRESLSYWLAIRDQYAHDDSSLGSFMQMAAERNIFDLRIRLDLEALQGAVDRYKVREGSYPFTLGALVTAGLVPSIPLDPAGKPYLYDRRTGQVTCQSPFKFKGRFGQW